MRCSMCGHESPGGSSFCLNCGSSLAQTPAQPAGLPNIIVCGLCRGENPPGMKYCRSCGNALASANPGTPAYGGPTVRPVPGQLPGPMPGPVPGSLHGVPHGPLGGFPPGPIPVSGGVPAYGPIGGVPGMAEPDATVPPSMAAPMSPAMAPAPARPLGLMPTSLANPMQAPWAQGGQGSTIACPRCGTQTPMGFAYCQQCGAHIQSAQAAAPAMQSSEAVTNVRPRSASSPAGPADGQRSIDAHAGTIAQDGAAARPSGARPQAVASWGTAVLVNRDGSDGQRHALAGEYLVLGRAGADIAFEDDRFLARQHARLERGSDGVARVHPLDSLNGVFRKTDAPVELVDGTTILIGREVLRYERIEPEEVKAHPLVRHGVALFGSPPRDPWGRFVQLLPSGGYRDVRHLTGEEVVLGREEGDIVFRDDAFMSRRHAAVTWDGRRAQITDLGSSNGTFVRLTGPTALKHGDHVRLGDQLLRIELGR